MQDMYLIVAFLHFEQFFFLVALQDSSLYFCVVIAISHFCISVLYN